MNNVIQMPPVNDSFNKGSEHAKIAVKTGSDYLSAYSDAVVDSINYRRPADYMAGFVRTYRAEEEKEMVG